MSVLKRAAQFVILCIAIASLAERTWAQDGDEAELPELPENFVFPPFTCNFAGQFPYIVSVRDGTEEKEHLCGGIVIAENAVLTAAHCVDQRSSNRAAIQPRLHIGGQNTDEPVEKLETLVAIGHPGWTGNLMNGDDLVILKLNQSTCVTPVTTLGAEDPYDRASQGQLFFLGFGRTSIGGRFSYVLNAGFMNTFNITHCNERYDMQPELTEDAVCVRAQTTVGICTGDDGGPLILQPTIREMKDVLVGIASFSTAGCTETEGVSVMMNVHAYTDWIEETLQSERFLNA